MAIIAGCAVDGLNNIMLVFICKGCELKIISVSRHEFLIVLGFQQEGRGEKVLSAGRTSQTHSSSKNRDSDLG
jgi:hypothetical protein